LLHLGHSLLLAKPRFWWRWWLGGMLRSKPVGGHTAPINLLTWAGATNGKTGQPDRFRPSAQSFYWARFTLTVEAGPPAREEVIMTSGAATRGFC